MEVLIILLVLGILLGSLLGFIAFFRISSLERQLKALKYSLQSERYSAKSVTQPIISENKNSASPRQPDRPFQPAQPPTQSHVALTPQPPTPKEPGWLDKLVINVRNNWLIWVGGVSLGLAGVFMVRYSIEHNLLSPLARIILTTITALTLHVGAAWLRIRGTRYTDILSAVAGGASIMLYACILAALHLYSLLSAELSFALLAIVSFLTMLLALYYGPVLAALGILGGYAVPVLVSTGSNDLTAALIYSFIITAAALALIHFVYRRWLWIGVMVGAGFWWVASLPHHNADLARLIYLLALIYLLPAMHTWHWRLTNDEVPPATNDTSLLGLFNGQRATLLHGIGLEFTLMLYLLLLAWMLTLTNVSIDPAMSVVVVAFSGLTLFIASKLPGLSMLGWLGLAATLAGMLLRYLLNGVVQADFVQSYLIMMLVMLSGYLLIARRLSEGSEHGYWASLAYLSPGLLLATGYTTVPTLSQEIYWALFALMAGAGLLQLLQLARKTHATPSVFASLILGAHLCLLLVAVVMLQEATLTLALAVLVISLVWLDRYFTLTALTIAAKLVVASIILRLTLNPWLLSYDHSTHWTLWTGAGSVICLLVAARQCGPTRHSLLQWLIAAAMHLFALTLAAEVRFQLYDGDVFANQYSFIEAAINTFSWGLMALAYYYRQRVAGQMETLYRAAATLFASLAAGNYVLVLLLSKNPFFHDVDYGQNPIFNLLLLAYLAPVILSAIGYWLVHKAPLRRLLALATGVCLFVFVNLEIRDLWNGAALIDIPISEGEMYTYSTVWLLLAIAAIIAASLFNQSRLYKTGMSTLLIVVLKIFLFDTADLDNLWRVASFMGLGICLLLLAWFHQRFGLPPTKSDADGTIGVPR